MRFSSTPLFRSVKPALCLVFLCLLSAGLASAQTVTIDLNKTINVLTPLSVGFDASTDSAESFQIAGDPYLHTAGITAPRYPGNHGVADIYHWSTNSVSKYKGNDAPYISPESNLANFALMAERLGSAVIVVNYGTNLDGNGGGEPSEAAAEVAWANGEPTDTRPIPKDSTGHDWHTVGYWATIRSQAPLSVDDGYNFLRIKHPKPFEFKLWQVGDQIFNNGYFGGDHYGNPDLHGPAPTTVKDYGALKRSPKLSPEFFAQHFLAFADAMKAVDPTILVGVGLTTPPDGDQKMPGWNRDVLKTTCPAIGFVSIDWETAPLAAPDYKYLDEDNLFTNTRKEIGDLINGMLDDDRGACPKDHIPRIALSDASIPTWPKIAHPIVLALWVADTYSLLVESGFVNIDWPKAYDTAMMSEDRRKFGQVFYGLQMFHIVSHTPGDMLVDAKTSAATVEVHATRRQDGVAGIMLVNSDSKASATVKVSIKGGKVGAAGKRFDYGIAEFERGVGPAASPLAGVGNEFQVTIPPDTITDLLLPATN